MSPPVRSAAVTARRILARRPWIHWLIVLLAALGASATAFDRMERVDAARRAWGDTATVYVATRAVEPGDAIAAAPTEMPIAMVAVGAVAHVDGGIARQRIGVGEVITSVDVVSAPGPTALIPAGWLGVPVVESPPSGAELGARVHVVSDGIAVSEAAVVVGSFDDVTLVAVPADAAAMVAAAAEAGSLTLLLVP